MAERYIRIHLHCDNIYDNIPDSERLVPFEDGIHPLQGEPFGRNVAGGDNIKDITIKGNEVIFNGQRLCLKNDGLFFDYFRGEVCRLVEAVYGQRLNPHLPRDYQVQHIAPAFVQTVRWWLAGECTRTPEEVTACFLAVTEPLLA